MSDHRALTRSPAVLRASAVLAVTGGGLRLPDGFTTDVLPGGTLALHSLATDVFLLARHRGHLVATPTDARPATTTGVVIFVQELSRSARRPSTFSSRRSLINAARSAARSCSRSRIIPGCPTHAIASSASGIEIRTPHNRRRRTNRCSAFSIPASVRIAAPRGPSADPVRSSRERADQSTIHHRRR
jgi:hypothetical protein